MDRDRYFQQQRLLPNQQYYGARPRPQFDFGRSQHSINFITEDFLAGFQEDGRMSVVRRFFCLFVTFDVIFISLLWIISVVITGENIYDALRKQVLHYSIYTSLFDVIAAAICRFCILILFYGLCYINHWTIVALCTSASCGFLVAKVFYYDWAQTPQPLFEVLLVIISFVLSWGEAWFLDCRVIPQERHARNYFIAATSPMAERGQYNERSPLLVSFLNSTQNYTTAPESLGNFYSPIDSGGNSDDETDMTEDYKKIGIEAVKRAFELLESKDWKIEKVTPANDTIQSIHRDGLGKVYRLTARIPCATTILLNNLFYRIEDVPNWNPTLLESKIIETIDSHTDITYQATIGGGGGMVKCRDFVNLRCWQLLRDGKVIMDYELPSVKLKGDIVGKVMSRSLPTQELQKKLTALTESETESTDNVLNKNEQNISSSLGASIVGSDNKEDGDLKFSDSNSEIATLSKSLGAKHFNDSDHNLSDDEVGFLDAKEGVSPAENIDSNPESPGENSGCESEVYISAAVSVTHNGAPQTQKYIRGENLVSCWAMRQIPQQTNWCIFEWLLCLDLKGYIPRYVLDAAYSSLMQDYMKYLRQHCDTINSLSKCTKCNKTDYNKKCLCSKSS